MPVIVVGADASGGRPIIEALAQPGREVRAFVSDIDAAAWLKSKGVKVAIGDVSDDGHIEGAASGCFTAVFLTEAATDQRERSFAAEPIEVLQGWARAAVSSGVNRVIWVSDEEPPPVDTPEVAVVAPSAPDCAREVFDLDDAQMITADRQG